MLWTFCLGHSGWLLEGRSLHMMHPWSFSSNKLHLENQGTTNPNKQFINFKDYLKGGDSKYISKGRENVAKPKHFVEVMTRRSWTAISVHPRLPPMCESPKHSAAIYRHIHGIKQAHNEAYSSPDFPQTHLICTVVWSRRGVFALIGSVHACRLVSIWGLL